LGVCMSKERLAAFSDGVIAIIITIMVLELKVPHGADWSSLLSLWPIFLSYVLSFVYIAIYWNNHHHLLHTFKHVNGRILWANTHLLFWLSLIPFTTRWMGENNFARLPTATYGVALFMPALAYYILQLAILKSEESILAKAIGRDWKGKISPVLYLLGIGFSFFESWMGCAIYTLVALIWLIPDKRIERLLQR
jgi:TMEM175 potassium channel family protein